jgi:L-sorbose 1-phosphate reductase
MPAEGPASGPTYRYWPYEGAALGDLPMCRTREAPVPVPGHDEVLVRVEAVSICSSDLKIVRLGAAHPLFSQRVGEAATVLGHEVCLRVHEAGAGQMRFRPGQRLGLQPAMRVRGQRQIFGMDLPGGFAEFMLLGPESLADYVFEVPEHLTAAEIALLEPYACVERAYRPNCRQAFRANGDALFVLGPDADRYTPGIPLDWNTITTVNAHGWDARGPETLPAFLAATGAVQADLAQLAAKSFDDVIVLGEVDGPVLASVLPLIAPDGLLLQARLTRTTPVPIDPAMVHYNGLALVGTASAVFTDALTDAAQRFDVRAGGVALVHGAGGAMGRIHIHRLLQMRGGPDTVIATSRKGSRLDTLASDFGPMAAKAGRKLILAEADTLPDIVALHAPRGLDDAIVVAPDIGAVADAASWLAPDGLLAVFAGFPFGGTIMFDLASVATSGRRLTGSTGCTVADMRDVLARIEKGELEVLANVRAVAGLDAMPQAFLEVSRGTVSGKIVIYPQAGDTGLRLLDRPWTKEDEAPLIAVSDRSR